MFLEELNKKECIAFVNLIHALANIDEVFSEKERELIDDYIRELNLTKDAIGELTFDGAVQEVAKSTDRSKNIIYFELFGVALVDGEFDNKEIEFLNSLASKIGISAKKQQDFIDYFKTVQETYDSTFVDYESKLASLEELAKKLI